MKKLNVKTASTQAGKIVPVQLGTQCRRAMIKNFSAGDIWVGVTPDSTKTDGMIRIPSEGAQLLVVIMGISKRGLISLMLDNFR